MRLTAGIEALDMPALFRAARRRIILHAAVYGAFAKSPPHRSSLETTLGKPDFKRLDVIVVEPGHDAKWIHSFLGALRFGISIQGIRDEIESSHRYMTEMQARYPDKIHLHPVRRLPCLPIVVADDTIVFGQYAHAEEHAPQGFWGIVETDVERLLQWAETGKTPTEANNEDLAAFRLVNECVRAMNTNQNESQP